MKERIKSYSFWVSLTSALILILKLIGQKYGFIVDELFISDLITSICSVLVILGIIVVPKNQTEKNKKESTITSNPDLNNEDNQTANIQNDEEICDVEPSKNNIESNEENIEEVVVSTAADETEVLSDDIFSPQEETIYTENSHNSTEQTIAEYEILKQHIDELLCREKERYLNDFNAYKQILIDKINNDIE